MIRTAVSGLRGLAKPPAPLSSAMSLCGGQPSVLIPRAHPAIFYCTQPGLAPDIEDFMRRHEITVSDPRAPAPSLTFEDSGLPDYLLTKLSRDFPAPTPIQAQSLPIAMTGGNMVGIGQTGSGKTLAFLLPAFLHIKKERERLGNMSGEVTNKGSSGPLVLVLAPTRELAKQIEDVARQWRNVTRIRTVCCIGGEGRAKQLAQYDSGAEIMIATPGRINDFVETGEMSLSKASYVVLDEADRMLDMGFEPQVRSVMEAASPERQTMMFSATWPDEVKDLAQEFLGNFTFMKIGSEELCANKNIHQEVIVTTKDYKMEQFLIDMEEKLSRKKVLVFTERKATVDRLERLLRNRRVRAMGIHGDKSQVARGETLKRFKDGSCKVMIATDVAARGLDVNDIDWVVNFDFPLDIENYIHRIGRTGRAEKKGSSLTYMTWEEARYAKKLKKILLEAGQNVPEELEELEKEGARSKTVKSKEGLKRQQSQPRFRNYGYRGMGRDDGDRQDEYDFRNRNKSKKSSKGYDNFGFPL